MKRMRSAINRFFNFLIFLFSIIFLITMLFSTWIFLPPERDEEIKRVIEIPYGYSTTEIKQLLEKEGFIRPYNFLFPLMTKLLKIDGRLQSGEYQFSTSQDLIQIIDQMVKGRVVLHRITIPEGLQSRQIARLLSDREIAEQDSFLNLINEDRKYHEGYLFPDTYEFPKNYGAEKVLKAMLRNFEEVVYRKVNPEQKFPGDLNFQQIIILASIIEKEAQGVEDKPKIASVFYNRLATGMRLQSCATVQYLLDKPQEKLTQQDLEIESPFNTYLNAGLPPEPICNPGLESILAAVYPTEEDYFYFVLGKDGEHVFSRTYQEHLDNKP